VDLAADASLGPVPLPDPAVSLDFDIDFSCAGGQLTIASTNFQCSADSEWYWEVVTFYLIELLDNEVEARVGAAFEAIASAIDGLPECQVSVGAEGDVFIEMVEPDDDNPAPGFPGSVYPGGAFGGSAGLSTGGSGGSGVTTTGGAIGSASSKAP
jgi:hypothetical protein